MCLLKLSDRLVAVFVLLAALAGVFAVVSMATSCTPTQQPGAEPQWPPQVSVESASIRGVVEVDTPAGPVLVSLESGLAVGGDGETSVRRVDVSAEVTLLVNGSLQRTTLATRGSPQGEKWAQCATIEAAVSIAGLAVTLRAVPPWLHASCGPAKLELDTPFGTVTVPKAVPTQEEPKDTAEE